jgi:UPF0271 protein
MEQNYTEEGAQLSEVLYVLDSTAFYSGIPYLGSGKYYTTYSILDEVKHKSIGSQLVHTRVRVTEPSRNSIKRVREIATKTGDLDSLSEADISLIALALDLISSGDTVYLVSDDFAVRNVADSLGIPLSQTVLKGSEWHKISWIMKCRGCGKEYKNSKLTECPVCGTRLVKKPVNNS